MAWAYADDTRTVNHRFFDDYALAMSAVGWKLVWFRYVQAAVVSRVSAITLGHGRMGDPEAAFKSIQRRRDGMTTTRCAQPLVLLESISSLRQEPPCARTTWLDPNLFP